MEELAIRESWLADHCTAVCEDIPHNRVRKSGMPNITWVLAGLVSHGG
jgi:hypothetical protein